jgi:hypothetical protein
MKERLRQMERLSRLRESQERMREAELLRERSRLATARQVAGAAQSAFQAETAACRELLLQGDTVASRMADQAARLAAAWHMHCAERVAACVERVEAATQRHRESRLQVEQSTRLAETISRAIGVEEQRRLQAVSDERFAARRHWTAGRDARRSSEDSL